MPFHEGKIRVVETKSDGSVVVDLFGDAPPVPMKESVLESSFNASIALCLTALINDWKIKLHTKDNGEVLGVKVDRHNLQ